LASKNTYIVYCCWYCRNGSDCQDFEDFENDRSEIIRRRLETHIKCTIQAYNPNEIITLFANYADHLYKTDGYLSYEEGNTFQLFNLNKNTGVYTVNINGISFI
jgi:hypothetical protein